MSVNRIGYLVFAGIMLVGAVGMQRVARSIYDGILTEDDRYYLPSARWMRVFSLGTNEAAADLVWIKTLIYFGGLSLKGSKSDSSEEQFTAKYMLTAAELDPHFYSVYKRGAALTLLQNGRVTRESAEVSIKLLELGLEYFPDDGDLLFDLGFLHYYEMPSVLSKDPGHPERKRHRERGIALIRRAALLGGGPPTVRTLASTLLKREGMDDLVVEHLQAMLAIETDETIRSHLIWQLKQAVGERANRDIEQSAALLREWKEAMPYVSFDLYSVLRAEVPLEEVKDPLYSSNQFLGLYEDDSEPDEDGEDAEEPAS